MASILFGSESLIFLQFFFYFGSVFNTHSENASIDLDMSGGSTQSQVVKYSTVKFHLHLERLPAYYLLNIIIPTVVLALLSAFTFYVPVDSGEKLSLSITILLSFSVFLLMLSENTPQVSQDLPFLGNTTDVFSFYNVLLY